MGTDISRIKEYDENGNVKYSMDVSFLRSEEIKSLVDKYSSIVNIIVLKKKNKQDINSEVEELNKIRDLINSGRLADIKKRNVLSGTRIDDTRIGYGQDSIVYEFQDKPDYVYKEGKESKPENIEYLKKKYKILQKYLGDLIPKSFFVLGESFSTLSNTRWLKDGTYIATKSLTVQRKIKGKDVSKMTNKEKRDIEFLSKLEKGHKKYVLLKLFLEKIIKELSLPKKSMDLQLDLGALSNRDSFHHDELGFIEGKLKSPNIMWDGENLYFIDFGFGEWDENKEIIYEKMFKESTFKDWKEFLRIYGLD